MRRGSINQIIPFSSVDGPGNRTAIFLQGCNFNCVYCHNPETINHCNHCGSCIGICHEGALRKEEGKVLWDAKRCIKCGDCTLACKRDSSPKVMALSVEEIMTQINQYAPFIQGITVSGGECTLQEAFLTSLFKAAREIGLTCFLDTNGSTPLWEMGELMALTDGVMLDVKSWDPMIHMKYIGAGSETVKTNLEYLLRAGKLYEVRTVVVPEVLDAKLTITEVAQCLGEINPNVRYKLIKYRGLGTRPNELGLRTPSDEEMKSLAQICTDQGCKQVIIV